MVNSLHEGKLPPETELPQNGRDGISLAVLPIWSVR